MIRRKKVIQGVLLVVWCLVMAWQIQEHRRVSEAVKAGFVNRAKDITTTVGLVMRSQRRFGVISQDRLESALNSLIKPGELNSIALLNDAGEIVASAGEPVDLETKELVRSGVYWAEHSVALVNLVDLGSSVTSTNETPPTIILPRTNIFNAFGTNRPPPGEFDRSGGGGGPPPGPPPPGLTNAPSGTNSPGGRGWRGRGDGREGRPPFGRPFWMSEEEYKAAVQKQGAHNFVIVLSTRPMDAILGHDQWLRAVILILTTIAVAGVGLAWRNIVRSSELEVRLVRAAELNARLKEMNLAAAGLAHETKNPLNIIRGLAQLISRDAGAAGEVQEKSRSIVAEADRVTAQLNEFINYSRPREVRRTPVALASTVAEVVRTLGYDLEEKDAQLSVAGNLPVIEADEQLLRQALFNLLLNAVQAVERGGHIEVSARPASDHETVLEIRDNGPGVAPEHRTDIFKPYFTKTQNGTGLGLAVVQQIVLAHGWDIECLANTPRGAIFRLAHLRLAPNA